MNTLVFVMMVYSHGENWVPLLEFTTEQKCVAAAMRIKVATDPHVVVGRMRLPFCVGIEK